MESEVAQMLLHHSKQTPWPSQAIHDHMYAVEKISMRRGHGPSRPFVRRLFRILGCSCMTVTLRRICSPAPPMHLAAKRMASLAALANSTCTCAHDRVLQLHALSLRHRTVETTLVSPVSGLGGGRGWGQAVHERDRPQELASSVERGASTYHVEQRRERRGLLCLLSGYVRA